MLSNLSLITNGLNWKTVAILQTHEDPLLTRDLHDNLPGISLLHYAINPFSVSDTLNQIHDLMFPDINILLTGDAGHLTDVLLKADTFDEKTNHHTDFRHHSKWLIISNDSSFLKVEKDIFSLENAAVVLISEETPYDEVFEIHMTLERHIDGSLFTPVARCGADIIQCYFPNVRYGYNKRQLRVMTIPSVPYVMKEEVNGVVFFRGYAPDILHIIAKTLNLSYSLIEPGDAEWGVLENDTWYGIVGYLQRGEIDLAACDLTIHEDRSRVVDYIYPPIKTDGKTILYKRQQQSYFFILTRPFRGEVYLVIIAVTFIVHVVFNYFESNRLVKEGENIMCRMYRILVNSSRNHIGRAFFKQGTTDSPDTGIGKVLVSSWWLFVMTITSVYCANLVASFSTQKDVQPFNNMEELLNTDYGVGIIPKGITYSVLKNTNLDILKRIFQRIQDQDQRTLNMLKKDHVEKVKRDKYAFITYRTSAELYKVDDCELDSLDEDILLQQIAFAVPKGSPLRKDIESVMSNLKESGILDILWRKWTKSGSLNMCVNVNKVNPVVLKVLGGGGVIVFVGIFLAFIILIWERLKIHKNWIISFSSFER